MPNIYDFLAQSDAPDMHSLMDIQDMDGCIDGHINFENNDLMTSEFFDSVLSMERENLENKIDDYFLNDINSEATFSDGSSSHVEEVLSPNDGGTSSDCDFFNINAKNEMTLYKDDINDQNTIPLFRHSRLTENISPTLQNPAKLLLSNQIATKFILNKPANNNNHQNTKKTIPKAKQQVLRVQSLSGNGRSLLLPVNVKNVKIINASDLKVSNMKITPVNCQTILKTNNIEKYASDSVNDDETESEINVESRYPPLKLTSEEKRLLFKEGIQLPSHYPLTKNQEKELKRIRRKIRNKISAQDSRKRKKEYVDKLEEKAKRTTDENEALRKKIKQLRKQNNRLLQQMKKLQELLFNSSSSKATPTTCLMIVLFSTLLVCLPNIRTSNKTEIGEQQLHAARRALLFNQQASNEDEALNLEEYLVFNKEDESELENFEEDVNEIDNNTEHGFVNFLNELTKNTELLSPDNNCNDVKDDHILEFCKKYEGDIKKVINNMKELLEKDSPYPNDKKFVEPDISDDEDTVGKRKYNDEPPNKKIKLNMMENLKTKDLPIFHEYNSTIVDDVISATVETKTYERIVQQE